MLDILVKKTAPRGGGRREWFMARVVEGFQDAATCPQPRATTLARSGLIVVV